MPMSTREALSRAWSNFLIVIGSFAQSCGKETNHDRECTVSLRELFMLVNKTKLSTYRNVTAKRKILKAAAQCLGFSFRGLHTSSASPIPSVSFFFVFSPFSVLRISCDSEGHTEYHPIAKSTGTRRRGTEHVALARQTTASSAARRRVVMQAPDREAWMTHTLVKRLLLLGPRVLRATAIAFCSSRAGTTRLLARV